jgi:O-antigen/teichoic acid export membrane protein
MQRLNLRKNVRFAIAEFAINMALVFFGYRLIIQQSGLEAVGVWATLYAWTSLIRLGDTGVAGAAARFLALWDATKERHRIRTHSETALITNIVQFGALALIGYVALSPFAGRIVGSSHAAEAEKILPWMMLGFFLLNISGTVLGVLQGLHLGYRRSQLAILGTAIQLASVFALVPAYGLLGLAVAQIVQHGAVIILGWSLARREIEGNLVLLRFNVPAFRAMLGYSVKAQVVNIANGLMEPLAKMLVGHFGGMATQGLFELAWKTVLLPRNLVGSGVTATIPAMTTLFHEGREELHQLYARVLRLSALSMGAAALALILLAPLLSLLWLERVDASYCLYVTLLTGGFFFNVLGIPAYVLGMASGHMRNNIVITLATLVGLSVGGVVLGHLYGGIGAVVASAGAIAMLGIFLSLVKRIDA